MLDARKAKELAGIDPRTTREKLRDEIFRYIEFEAKRGNRTMRYKIPDKFMHPDLIIVIQAELENLDFDVYHDIKENILEVRW